MTRPVVLLDRVREENFTRGDIERLRRWIRSQEELVRWAGTSVGFPFSEEEANRLYRRAFDTGDSDRLFRVIALGTRGEHDAIGHIELRQVLPEHGTARVGRVLLDPERRGQGLGLAMVRAVVDHAFGELALRRLDLEVFPDNAPALRCYESVGFVREGLRRQAVMIGKQAWDLVGMGMLRAEWKAIQDHHE